MARAPDIKDSLAFELSKNWSFATEFANKFDRPWLSGLESFLPSPPALIVPVNVQALYVPPGGGERFVIIPYAISDKNLSADKAFPPAFTDPVQRPEGIHLHWALPNGLLRGQMDSEELRFRPLPDQWQVTRLTMRRNATKLDLKSWSIDAATGQIKEVGGTALPSKAVSLTSDTLDAGIGGGIEWTSSYDAAQGRFAFFDNLADVKRNGLVFKSVSYTIIGWWSLPAHDPLNGKKSVAATANVLGTMSWRASDMPIVKSYNPIFPQSQTRAEMMATSARLQPASVPRETIPKEDPKSPAVEKVNLDKNYRIFIDKIGTQNDFYFAEEVAKFNILSPITILSGSVYNIDIGPTIRSDAAPNESAIELAAGWSLGGLVSAFASKTNGINQAKDRTKFERMLHAIANDSLAKITSPEGMVAADAALHMRGFEAHSATDEYEDIMKGDGRDDIPYGRLARTKLSLAKQKQTSTAEVVYFNGRRGSSKNTYDEQIKRQESHATSDRPASGAIRTVRRRGPRYYLPTLPLIGIRNYRGSPSSGDFEADGTLSCRWDSELQPSKIPDYDIREVMPVSDPAFGRNVFRRILENDILSNPALAPSNIDIIAKKKTPAEKAQLTNRVRAEHVLRYGKDALYKGKTVVSRDMQNKQNILDDIDQKMLAHSLFEGVEPSPYAVTLWSQPWSPLWLEWRISVKFNRGTEGCTLGMLDYEGEATPTAENFVLEGRSVLTKGVQKDYHAAISTFLEMEQQSTSENLNANTLRKKLSRLRSLIETADVASVTLDRFNLHWLGISKDHDGLRWEVDENGVESAIIPDHLPILLSAGEMTIERARIIDGFGRVRELNTQNIATSIQDMPVEIVSNGRFEQSKSKLQLPPRLRAPARLMWRLVDPADLSVGAKDATLNQAAPDQQINPIAGYLMPDFLDEAIEFFDQNGQALGQILREPLSGHVKWEIAPMRTGHFDATPDYGLIPSAVTMGQIASELIRVDAEERALGRAPGQDDPLTALLKVFQTTQWTMGGSSLFSSSAVAGLVGHPIAVVRAKLLLEMPDDCETLGLKPTEHAAIIAARRAAFDAFDAIPLPVRLGEISSRHDGLYGYFVGNDFAHLKLVEAEIQNSALVSGSGEGYSAPLGDSAARTSSGLPPVKPIRSPYLAHDFTVNMHRNQPLFLTLLMHPYADINATSGLLPRKSLRLLRDWVDQGLNRVAPSARIGPVLIDPDKVRLPKIAAFGQNQNWTRRSGPLTWKDDPILAASQAALLPAGKVTIEEGFIRVVPVPDANGDR